MNKKIYIYVTSTNHTVTARHASQQALNVCITSVQWWANVEDVESTLYNVVQIFCVCWDIDFPQMILMITVSAWRPWVTRESLVLIKSSYYAFVIKSASFSNIHLEKFQLQITNIDKHVSTVWRHELAPPSTFVFGKIVPSGLKIGAESSKIVWNMTLCKVDLGTTWDI